MPMTAFTHVGQRETDIGTQELKRTVAQREADLGGRERVDRDSNDRARENEKVAEEV